MRPTLDDTPISPREPAPGRGGPGRPTRGLRIRTWGAIVLVTAAFVLIGYRAFILQVRESSLLRSMAEDQYLRDVEIPPRRGRILDRNGVTLAASAEVDSLACNQRVVDSHASDIAKALVRTLAPRATRARTPLARQALLRVGEASPRSGRGARGARACHCRRHARARAASLLSQSRSRRAAARLGRSRRCGPRRPRARVRQVSSGRKATGAGPTRCARSLRAHRRSR